MDKSHPNVKQPARVAYFPHVGCGCHTSTVKKMKMKIRTINHCITMSEHKCYEN